MRITHLRLANWRNFRSADLSLQNRVFVVGPNASGKSNLLDAIRFLRDVANNGFQSAVDTRDGLERIRCLATRSYNQGHVTISVNIGDDNEPEKWHYELTFKSEGRGHRRPIIQRELIMNKGKIILDRPNQQDREDPERLINTDLGTVQSNKEFRELSSFLDSVSYLHMVPQFLRNSERVIQVKNDHYGADLPSRMAKVHKRTRERRLRSINRALRIAIPQFSEIFLRKNEQGQWHLMGSHEHWKRSPALLDERAFSDGTLRLIGLLWILLDSKGPVLLEEPELTLHSELYYWIPSLIFSIQKRDKQAIMTTHSTEMLHDPGVGPEEVVLIQPTASGSIAKTADQFDHVLEIMNMDFPVGDAITHLTHLESASEISLIFSPL